MYQVRKLSKVNIVELKTVSDILYECGKDMAKKYDLHHWDNSHMKNYIIVALCAMKNDIYLVHNKKNTCGNISDTKNRTIIFVPKVSNSPFVFRGGGYWKLLLDRD